MLISYISLFQDPGQFGLLRVRFWKPLLKVFMPKFLAETAVTVLELFGFWESMLVILDRQTWLDV